MSVLCFSLDPCYNDDHPVSHRMAGSRPTTTTCSLSTSPPSALVVAAARGGRGRGLGPECDDGPRRSDVKRDTRMGCVSDTRAAPLAQRHRRQRRPAVPAPRLTPPPLARLQPRPLRPLPRSRRAPAPRMSLSAPRSTSSARRPCRSTRRRSTRVSRCRCASRWTSTRSSSTRSPPRYVAEGPTPRHATLSYGGEAEDERRGGVLAAGRRCWWWTRPPSTRLGRVKAKAARPHTAAGEARAAAAAAAAAALAARTQRALRRGHLTPWWCWARWTCGRSAAHAMPQAGRTCCWRATILLGGGSGAGAQTI